MHAVTVDPVAGVHVYYSNREQIIETCSGGI